MMPIGESVFYLIVLSLVVASISWTFTQEELFHDVHNYCVGRSRRAKGRFEQKFFYVFTCEYCFSHWVTLIVLLVTGFHLLIDDWRGYIVAFFVLPWLANQWMSIYRRIRVEIKYENALAEKVADGDE